MNPEDNNNNQGDASATLNSALAPEMPTSEATPTEAPTTEEAPSLDQVAADLTSTTPESLAEASPEASAPETPAVEVQTTSENPATTATPATPATPESPAVSEPTTIGSTMPEPTASEPIASEPIAPETPAAPAGPMAPETPSPLGTTTPTETTMAGETPIAPAPAMDTAPVDAASTETIPDAPADFTSESVTSSASFVGDAPAAPKTDTSAEDEEPLKPADPVPGSIGSALAYSDSAPDHSVPVTKPKKTPLFDFKGNAKVIIMIVAAVVLVAIVVIVLLFVLNGTNNKKAPTTNSNTNTQQATTKPVVSSLTCTMTGDGTAFSNYGNVVSGEENVIAMYSDDTLTSLGVNMTLNYGSPEDATNGKTSAEQQYTNKYISLKLTADPFSSTYDATGNTVTVTHQADGEKITTENAKVMDLYVLRGEVVSDIETLKDAYESDGFTCVEK